VLAIKINDPAMEKELTAIANKQHISCQASPRWKTPDQSGRLFSAPWVTTGNIE